MKTHLEAKVTHSSEEKRREENQGGELVVWNNLSDVLSENHTDDDTLARQPGNQGLVFVTDFKARQRMMHDV